MSERASESNGQGVHEVHRGVVGGERSESSGSARSGVTLEREPLRIALLTYSTRPRGGVVHTLALAEALVDAGHRVDVWSLGRGGDAAFFRAVDPRVGIRLVPFPDEPDEGVGERILRSIRLLGAAFRDADGSGADGSGADGVAADRYDIVHAQDCISANAVPRCVRTIHHLDRFTTPELVACHEAAIRNPYAHICVSAAVAHEVRDGWGITATVIHNGVNSARFAAAAAGDPAATSARRAWTRRLGRYVLAVGGIEPRKGTSELVEAMALVRRADPTLTLVLAGGETLFDYRDYREQVFRRAAEIGVEPVVLGVVADPDLPSLVAAAQVFAFPSVKEGFGLAPMEALAAGVPVVMRDLPVLREIFGPAVAFADSPVTLADRLLDPPDVGRIACGRRLARGYNWAGAAARHVSFYRELTATPVPAEP